MNRDARPLHCGTVSAVTEPVLDAVREVRGRRPVRPASDVEAAEAEVRGYLVVPEWYAEENAADVAADVLRGLHDIEAAGAPYLWALYTEGARRLGSIGPVPVPVVVRGPDGTARSAEA